MGRRIGATVILAAMLLLCLVGCKSEPAFHPASTTERDDVAVMGTVEQTQNGESTETNGQNGNIYKKRVAITYDDGPHNVRTKMIVDELNKYGYNATFFVVGNRVDGTEYNGASGLAYAAEHGNEIAIHGYTHRVYYNKCSDDEFKDELSKTEAAIKKVLKGTPVRLMRPIGGAITDERIQQCKYSVILWNVDSEDWKYKYTSDDTDETAKQKVDTIVDNVMSNVKDGSIILMHDIHQSSCDATVIILQRLHEEGYDVVTVSELIGSDLAAVHRYSCK